MQRGLKFLSFAILFVGLISLSVMALWNALLPAILGVSTITFWQAVGLLILSRLLIGGPGWRGGPPWRKSGRGQDRRHPRYFWKQKMAQRWKQLTPEQREQLKAQWRTGCKDRE